MARVAGRRSRTAVVAPALSAVLLAAVVVAGPSGCASDRVIELGTDGHGGGGGGADVAAAPDGSGADAATPDAGPTPDTRRDAAADAFSDEGGSDAGGGAGDASGDDAMADIPGPPDGGPPSDGAATDGLPDGADATSVGRLDLTVEATVDGPGDFWAETERCRLSHDALRPEPYIAKTRLQDEALIAAFGGDAEPPPGVFLLHAAPGWDDVAGGRPVLLVHGAGSDATQSFVDPDALDPGLARDLSGAGLSGAGWSVFAVTFPARYGDNLNQALALAAALQRVREKTGAAQVDVVAHSKGGLAVLAYLAGMLDSRGVPYVGEVGRVALLGVPVAGMDFSFRHPTFNYSSAVWGLELPSSWDQALLWGVWQDTWDESIYGGAYDGLLQALARWDDVYPLSMTEQDWYTTYEGGQGFVSHSLGIDAALAQGGGFMADLRSRELPTGLPVGVLVGTSPYVGLTPWELTGPSDSLVFVASAGDTEWLAAAGATVVADDELAVNHWELVHVEEARGWVRALLQ